MKTPDTIIKILEYFGVRVARLYYFEKNLSDPIAKINPKIELVIKGATKKEISKLKKQVIHERGKDFLYDKQGKCLIAIHKDKIVGFIWINNKNVYFNQDKIEKISNNGSFIYQGYVFERFRGNRVFEKLIETAYTQEKNNGKTFCAGFVDIHNPAALSVQKRFKVNLKKVWLIILPFSKKIITGCQIGKGVLIKNFGAGKKILQNK
jgi:hypothetical protein